MPSPAVIFRAVVALVVAVKAQTATPASAQTTPDLIDIKTDIPTAQSSPTPNDGSLGDVIVDVATEAALNLLCDTAKTRPVNFDELGVDPVALWSVLDLDNYVTAFLKDGPAGGTNWVRFFYAFATEASGLRDDLICDDTRNPDKCTPSVTCEQYASKKDVIVSWAFQSLFKLMKAQHDAYGSAVDALDANDQELARALFHDFVFGKNAFGIEADNPLDVVKGVFDAFTDYTPLKATKLAQGLASTLFRALKKVGKSVKANIQAGPEPDKDGKPFVKSIRADFAARADHITQLLARYVNTASLDIDGGVSTPEEAVSMLGGGTVLRAFHENPEELQKRAQADLIKSVAIPVISGIWNQQKATISSQDRPCSGIPVMQFPGPNYDATKKFFPHSTVEFEGAQHCLTIFPSHQLFPTFADTLRRAGMEPSDVSGNAAMCELNGKAGIFPPAEEEAIDFGMPRCSFPLLSNPDGA